MRPPPGCGTLAPEGEQLLNGEVAMGVLDLFDLSGRVALVTGGSRGLGREMAEALGELGASLVITARRRQWLDEAEAAFRQAGFPCLALVCDVTDQAQVEALVERTLQHYGRLDVLVNCAGIAWKAPTEEFPTDRWRQVLDVNTTGVFLVSQAAGRAMIRRGGGVIINVSSITGQLGTPPEILESVPYTASKGAVDALTRDLAAKWARHGIRVNAVAPAFFRTRMTDVLLDETEPLLQRVTPLGRIGCEGELKGVTAFLASDASSYVTGQVINVDGGWSAV
ncbi:MAG TPA: glucose 1-dehydrogenase [Dehalococcoidia bacterium]